MLENPQNSLLALHERYVQFLKLLQSAGVTASWFVGNSVLEFGFTCSFLLLVYMSRVRETIVFLATQTKTYKVSMWMRKFQSFTWKRTWLWSCSNLIHRLDLGPMTSAEREGTISTTKKTEKHGKTSWTANANLKPTQRLGCSSHSAAGPFENRSDS